MEKLNFRIQRQNNLNEIEFDPTRQEISNGFHDYYVVCKDVDGTEFNIPIPFQNGARKEKGSLSGIADSDLLEIVKHRLEQFQSGAYACRENAIAITKITEALMWLSKRSNDRAERGVLGTNKR